MITGIVVFVKTAVPRKWVRAVYFLSDPFLRGEKGENASPNQGRKHGNNQVCGLVVPSGESFPTRIPVNGYLFSMPEALEVFKKERCVRVTVSA